MRKTLVIFGEAPGPNTDPKVPLFPHTTTGAAARLIKMLDVPTSEYLRFTSRYNVMHDGTQYLDLDQARRRVTALHYKHLDLNPECRFLYLGKAAINCAPKQYRDLQFLQGRDNVWLVPHPSGRNRVFNDVSQLDRVSMLLQSVWRDCQLKPAETP